MTFFKYCAECDKKYWGKKFQRFCEKCKHKHKSMAAKLAYKNEIEKLNVTERQT